MSPPSPRTAAYIDLDKTLLATSTTAALGSPLRKAGLISTSMLARGLVTQLPYLLFGADEAHTIAIMQRLARMTEGMSQATLSATINANLAHRIEPVVYAEALELIADHHAAGHDVVVISASALDMVAPVARMLGADRAMGTELEVDSSGRFTGRIHLPLLHAHKLDAMQEDARRHHVDLARSWAYSDSISDEPMLRGVGHPVAVNPDKDLRLLAQEENWPILDFQRPVALDSRLRAHLRSLTDHAPSPWGSLSPAAAMRVVVPAGAALALGVATAWLTTRQRN